MLGKDIVVGHRKGVTSLGYLFDSGGLEVEQCSDNRTLSIWVDQSPLGACILYGTIEPAMFCTS